MMRFFPRLLLALVTMFAVGAGVGAESVTGYGIQQDVGGPPPVNVSHSVTPSEFPLVTADHMGRVHVVWGENTSPDPKGPVDSAYYSSLVDGHWSEPIDIMAVPYGDSLRPDAFLVDPYDRLVLVWHQYHGVNVSIAPSDKAASARAWTTLSLDPTASVNSADLVVDDAETYHLVYVRDATELMYLVSTDLGVQWSKIGQVASADRTGIALQMPTIAVSKGIIYVSWTQNSEATGWGPVGVWFSRSLDGGATWSAPMELAPGAGFGASDLAVDNQGRVHLFWIGALIVGGRYHRWSEDGGQSWSPTIVVAEPDAIKGFAGKGYLLLDSADMLHVVVAGQGGGREQIWHSAWDGTLWQEMEPVSGNLPNSQRVSAAIAQGHRIDAVWIEYDSRDIWYRSFDTGSPPLIVQPAPLPATPAVSGLSDTTPSPVSSATTATTGMPPASVAGSFPAPTPRTGTLPMDPFVVGVVPVLIVVIVVITVKLMQAR